MRFPHLAHRSAAAHKLHSTPQQHRMKSISGSDQTTSRIPAFSLFSPEAVQTTETVAWKAATILAGAAVEALLLWAITEKKTPTEIEATRAVIISRASQDPNDWVLDAYIKVARAMALIEDETEKQADLARGFRNFIHPGRSARLGKACDRRTALSALAAVELIVRDLS